MNRPIKFRAKSLDGIWFKWELLDPIDMAHLAIDAETLGQFTGLLDKTGKEIFFGDILATSNNNPEYDIWNKEDNGYTVVHEMDDRLGVSYSDWDIDNDDEESIFSQQFVEVIGNIYENPNLIKA